MGPAPRKRSQSECNLPGQGSRTHWPVSDLASAFTPGLRDAVRRARQRCWRHDWVLDLYFDSIDWELLLRAVRRHTNRPWVLLRALAEGSRSASAR